ncbi:MAG: hypothetical protein CMI02_01610 [Oceanospirillaceae bacterium]|nr:hypothetical protein [Oceanospirillaceae bacterium]MBT10716.1 hypothetical protein [Oceanospirillaceae bacterium]
MSPRPSCSHCGRPLRVCLCAAITQMAAPVKLIIWQEKTEARHPLSTAPLLNLSIQNSVLLQGDQYDYGEVFGSLPVEQVAVLYPLREGQAVTEQQKRDIRALLIIDGTWRKTRKLMLQNPWLQQLPFIRLQPQTTSRYTIRTSPHEFGLSTIEAGVAALNWLSGGDEFDRVLAVLDRLVDIQLSHGHKGGK